MPPPPGRMPNRHLHLIDGRAAANAEAHVECLDQLAATTTHATLDLGDGHLGHRAVALAHLMKGIYRRPLGLAVDREVENRSNIEVRDEEIRIGALEHHDPHRIIVPNRLTEARDLSEKTQGHHIDRGGSHGRHGDAALHLDSKQLVIVVAMSAPCCSRRRRGVCQKPADRSPAVDSPVRA